MAAGNNVSSRELEVNFVHQGWVGMGSWPAPPMSTVSLKEYIHSNDFFTLWRAHCDNFLMQGAAQWLHRWLYGKIPLVVGRVMQGTTSICVSRRVREWVICTVDDILTTQPTRIKLRGKLGRNTNETESSKRMIFLITNRRFIKYTFISQNFRCH